MKKERKLQIVKAAAKRFAGLGLNKTTLAEIAKDIRIGKATIYHYFKTKDDLFYAAIEWETEQFIDDVKTIFNNEELAVGARLLEYITFKERVFLKYKLLFSLMLKLIEDDSFEKERRILNSLLTKEEEIVKLVLSSIFSNRLEGMNESLPGFIVSLSWGGLFGNRLNKIKEPAKIINSREFLFRILETILN